MPAPTSDRNLLFAVLALQNDLASRDAVVEAMNAWAIAKDRPLGDLLVERGALSADGRRLLDALLDFQIAKHGSPEQSLAAVELGSSAREALCRVADADVQASLAGRTGAYHSVTDGGSAPAASGSRFRILKPHARGGLGEVFVAEDTELKREVALKQIIDRHAGDPANRCRFVAEAEITGRLEHPGIVPVYGLGAYADGRPFYAMRFVRGDTLAAAAKRFHETGAGFASVEFRQLLGRFVDVCDAVAYAHSRGVLHRDLKPGNVMLGKFGETLVVDWGLAKIVGRGGADGEYTTLAPVSGSGSVETVGGAAIGTPAFMSPEQAEGLINVLGPATDIYSLGATLYVLLTGRPPVHGSSVSDVLEKVRRGDTVPAARSKPGVPAALAAVCAKAMAMESDKHYTTAQALSAEVVHWLADEPIVALRDMLSARVTRWTRKHPGVTAGLTAALVVGVFGLALDLVAVRAERQRTERQASLARAWRETTEAVLTFVEDNVFAATQPQGQRGGLGHEVTLRRAVEAALQAVTESFPDRPLAEARLRRTMGVTFLYLGQAEVAAGQLRRSLSLFTAELGPEHEDTLKSACKLAESLTILGQHADALVVRKHTLAMRRANFGPDHPDTFACMCDLAETRFNLGEHAEAMILNMQALELMRAKLGSDHSDTLRPMTNLDNIYAAMHRSAEALTLRKKVLALRQMKLGPDHPTTLDSMSRLAESYIAGGRFNDERHEQALVLIEDAL